MLMDSPNNFGIKSYRSHQERDCTLRVHRIQNAKIPLRDRFGAVRGVARDTVVLRQQVFGTEWKDRDGRFGRRSGRYGADRSIPSRRNDRFEISVGVQALNSTL